MSENWRPDLCDENVLLGLTPREAPYFNILQYCRHLGVQVRPDGVGYWVARVRKKDGGYSAETAHASFWESSRC